MRVQHFISLLLLVSVSALFAQGVEFKHPNVIDVGKTMKGDLIEGKIEFVNKSGSMLEIADVRPSCGCTAVKPEKLVYQNGEVATIPFSVETEKFNPGVVRKPIHIHFVDNKPERQTVTIQANIVTELAVNPRYLHLQSISLNPDTTITEFFEIENESDKPVEITDIKTEADFIKISPSSVVIPPGKSHLIQFQFKPATPGRKSTRISIQSNHEKHAEIKVPVYINVVNS